MKTNNIVNTDNDNKTNTVNALMAFCRKIAGYLEAVKRDVFAEYQAQLGANDQLLRLAIIEAEALAHQTDYPHLVFPLLAAEKAQNAVRWQFHQQFLLRSNDVLAA